MNDSQCELYDECARTESPILLCPAILFSKSHKRFLGYLHPVINVGIMQMNKCRGDPTNVSAVTKTVLTTMTVLPV